MNKNKIQRISLSGLLKGRKIHWSIACVLMITTLFSSIGLLSASGWFLTGAAISGLLVVEINYLAPSVLIRIFALSRTVSRYVGDLVSHNAVLHLLKDLRVNIFEYLAKHRSKLHNNHVNSVVITHRLAIDINRLDLFPLRFILPWLVSSVLVLFVCVLISFIHVSLLLYTLPAILLAWLVIPIVGFSKGIQLAKDEIILSEYSKEQLVQYLSLLTPLLIWKTWSLQHQKLADLACQRLQKRLAQQKFISLIKMSQDISLALALLGIIYQGADLVQRHALTVPWLLGVLLGVMGLVECLIPLAGTSVSLGLSMFSRDRINELVDNNQEKASIKGNEPEQIESLQLINVSGRISNALNGPTQISFSLEKGDILCIRGSSGVGKTTLLDLIAGEISPTEGSILLNQQSIEEWNLNNTLAYLTQHIDIFNFSLAKNLRIAKAGATDEELWQVLELVRLDEWAKSRDGLATQLGEFGAEVSGGQARRIALARLLLTNRSLILLDEPFAGLDNKNIELLYKRLVDYARDRIILIVSHRELSSYGCQEYWLSS